MLFWQSQHNRTHKVVQFCDFWKCYIPVVYFGLCLAIFNYIQESVEFIFLVNCIGGIVVCLQSSHRQHQKHQTMCRNRVTATLHSNQAKFYKSPETSHNRIFPEPRRPLSEIRMNLRHPCPPPFHSIPYVAYREQEKSEYGQRSTSSGLYSQAMGFRPSGCRDALMPSLDPSVKTSWYLVEKGTLWRY